MLEDQPEEDPKVTSPGLAVRRCGVVGSGPPLGCILSQAQLLQMANQPSPPLQTFTQRCKRPRNRSCLAKIASVSCSWRPKVQGESHADYQFIPTAINIIYSASEDVGIFEHGRPDP